MGSDVCDYACLNAYTRHAGARAHVCIQADLPEDIHLDGELWCGREQFERCVGIIKYHKGSTADEWKVPKICFFTRTAGERKFASPFRTVSNPRC